MHLPPTLQAIQTALDQGNAALTRDLLFRLTPEDRRALTELLGAEPAERLYRAARRGTRAVKRGKVVVLPGITGSELLAEYADGASRLLWIDFISLVLGRAIALLALTPNGEPADPAVHITPRGFVLGWYLNLVASLQNEWDVLPVSYDWRLDIDHSADALARRITEWARNEPVHVVAHSMGGLVTRRMIQRHPDLWAAMDDRDGRHRGGRLVMLGTPNRGSYSIPLTLTGDELMVKLLDVADLTKGRRAVLARLNSFPGTYQMLPSPEVRTDIGGAADDHLRLFDPSTWGDVPVQAALLARAQRFARELHGVVDPERMVYVAGYGEGTPSAIRVRGPGRFEYQRTTMGDGRVPHALGLLPGVPAYYVRESHGDLPKNETILAALTDLLLTGKSALETSPRLVRLLTRAATGAVAEPPGRWHDPGEFVDERAVDEFRLLVRSQRRGAAAAEPLLRAERILADSAGTPAAEVGGGRGAAGPARAPRARAAREPVGRTLALGLEVVWGDITRVESDVCAVGHYQGLEPQRAELAIDRYLVTGPPGPKLDRGDDRLVLTRLTHRGVLRGALGQIAFFPSARARRNGSGPATVAIAGMGYPGTFSRQALQQLAAQLADAVSTLPDAETLSLVLIGSGEGSLDIGEALTGLVAGLEQWAAADPTRSAPRLRRLRIVERDLGKAREIQRLLLEKLQLGELVTNAIRLDPARRMIVGPGGQVEKEYAAALYLVASGRAPTPAPVRRVLRGADPRIGGDERALDARVERAVEDLRESVLGAGPGGVPAGEPLLEAADRLASLIRVESTETNRATRLSYLRSEQGVRLAAITDRATVSERAIAVDFGLIRQQIEVMQTEEDPRPEDVNRVARLLRRILLPRDFRDLLYRSDAVIFDVDRAMAAVPWEIMQCEPDQPLTETGRTCPEQPEEPKHVALEMLVARQLRTTLSPSPQPDFEPTGQLEALVVADPDDSLEHAKEEGQAVAALLRRLGCCVRLLSGSKGGDGAEPASRSAVIDFLASRRRPLDLLHYAGHGDFDPADPSRVGWVFADGILGPNELRLALEAMPPLMVLSNSCLTGLLSETRRGRTAKSDTWDELGLVPALADIFLQQGVRHFIAANRPIYDQGAVDFATIFYRTLLAPPGASVGEAARAARRALHEQENLYGPLWAAYHHYGDPSARLRAGR